MRATLNVLTTVMMLMMTVLVLLNVGDRGFDQDSGNATVRGEAFITFSFDITYIIMLTICMHTA